MPTSVGYSGLPKGRRKISGSANNAHDLERFLLLGSQTMKSILCGYTSQKRAGRFTTMRCRRSRIRVAPRPIAFASAARQGAPPRTLQLQFAFQTKAGDMGIAEWNWCRGHTDVLRTDPSHIRTAHQPRLIMAKPNSAAWLTATRFLASINEMRFIAIAAGARGLCCCCACARVSSGVVEAGKKQ